MESVCGLVVKSVVAIFVFLRWSRAQSTGPGFDSRRTHFFFAFALAFWLLSRLGSGARTSL